MDEVLRSDVVDVVFSIRGESIDPDYANALWHGISGVLGWISHELRAGVHPLKGVTESGDRLVVARRAQLTLRLPQERAAEALELRGAHLDLGGVVEVGEAALRQLAPYPVLYSHFVSLGLDEEEQFVAEAARLVTAAGIECKLIVGKRRGASADAARISGFSLMLHGLSARHSLQVQGAGLGCDRTLGCGIFVPHKTIAAVGT